MPEAILENRLNLDMFCRFDAGSVMMYGPFGFAADPFRPTISTLDRNLQSTIGQRTAGPSFLDIQAVVAGNEGRV
jgi:hypothetical protein